MRLSALERQHNLCSQTTLRSCAQRQSSALPLRQVARDVQAQPSATAVARSRAVDTKEWLENGIEMGCWNAGPSVIDQDVHAVVIVRH